MKSFIGRALTTACAAVVMLSGSAFAGGITVSAEKSYEAFYIESDDLISEISSTVSENVPQITKPKASKGLSRDFIRVSWGASKNSRVYKYVVQRRISKNGWQTVATLPNMVNSYDDYVKNPGQTKKYEYRVRCKYVSGNRIKTSPGSTAGTVYGWLKLGITLDPGHYLGCNNNFAQWGYGGSYRYAEGTQMLKLGHYLKAELEKNNVDVKITRDFDLSADRFAPGVRNEKYDARLYNSLVTRGNYAAGTDFFISLHTNAVSHWAETNNWGIQCFPNDLCMSNSASLKLAADLGQTASDNITPGGISISRRIPFNKSLTTWSRSGVISYHLNGKIYYTVLWGAEEVGVPGILLEHSYHTNPAVRAWLLSDANLKKLAKAECRTILRNYGYTS